MSGEARYAIYLAPPPDSQMWRAGCAWLGRDPLRGAFVPPPELEHITADLLEAVTCHPRRYGFHGTLRSPMHLATGVDEAQFLSEVETFAAREIGFALPSLKLEQLRGFLALVPLRATYRLRDLERRCLAQVEPLRRPLSSLEIERRMQAGLSARQASLLLAWGYPHVLDQYHLHFTLSDSLSTLHPQCQTRLHQEAERHFGYLAERPFTIDALCVFREPTPGANFELLARMPFGRSGRLVYVVGPSGAGKDSILDWARRHLALQRDIVFARRTITRPCKDEVEQHEAVSDSMFTRLVSRQAFAFQWEAHGFRYGIRKEALEQLAAGMTVIINGSREHLPVARARVPHLEVVHITAPLDQIEQRLRERRRESADNIERRMERARQLARLAADLEISNQGELAQAGQRLLDWLLHPPGTRLVNAAEPVADAGVVEVSAG